jgi:choline dehydrogenase
VVDHLIVGAGTAGAILAARLSEDPGRQVLVLEAGPDYTNESSLPEPLRDAYRIAGDTAHDWGLQVAICGGREGHLARGKVVGGSSQVNGTGAVRPPAADFDAWAGLGLPGWSWERVLPAFCRLEADQQFGERSYHGADGPIPITRWGHDELVAPMTGFLDAVLTAGHPFCDDLNAPDAVGIGLYPQNRRGRLRVSTNLAYLAPARDRPNLQIRAGVTVDRVVVEKRRAVGVDADGEPVAAREVILCAGAPFSATLLLRSGIGPADELQRLRISQLVDLPGVGTGLIDRPGVAILVVPTANVAAGAVDGPTLQVLARLAAFPGHLADNAFYLCLFAGLDMARGPGPALAAMGGAAIANVLLVGDMATASRGRVELRSADPAEPPSVELGFYSADGDLARMRAAYRHAWEIANDDAFTATVDRFALVDDDVVADDERLDEMLQASTANTSNLFGGCPMGPDDDPLAVVDEHCRVRGVERLRVVDASIVPLPLRAPAALTCMMLGEHAAPWVAAGV